MPEDKSTKEELSSKDEGGGDKQKKPKKDGKLNKVVIRRLPPKMTEETFLTQIEPIPDHENFYFVPADSSGINSFSRAYLTFLHQEDIFIFTEKFDGYVFVDSKGAEYPAIVEFAPNQGLVKGRSRKKDPKANTIETEQHYLNFLELLKTEEAEVGKGDKFDFNWNKEEKKITSTPLLEFLANKSLEKREAKRRKSEERKKQREDEKQRRKIQVAKSVPEAIKEETQEKVVPSKPAEPKLESKDEVVYDDGVVIRTVPSRLSERERRKEKERSEKLQKENQRKREKELFREKKNEREYRAKEKQRDEERKLEQRKMDPPKTEVSQKVPEKQNEPKEKKVDPPKKEIKRYSERRKENRARIEKEREAKSSDTSEKSEVPVKSSEFAEPKKPNEIPGNRSFEKAVGKLDKPDENIKLAETKKVEVNSEKPDEEKTEVKKQNAVPEMTWLDEMDSEEKKRDERRAKEQHERALRRIRNKDRPAMEIYQPKRRLTSQTSINSNKQENSKSSDENSATSQKKVDRKTTRNAEKDKPRRNSRDEGAKKKRCGKIDKQKSDSSADQDSKFERKDSMDKIQQNQAQIACQDEPKKIEDPIAEKLESLNIQENNSDSNAVDGKVVENEGSKINPLENPMKSPEISLENIDPLENPCPLENFEKITVTSEKEKIRECLNNSDDPEVIKNLEASENLDKCSNDSERLQHTSEHEISINNSENNETKDENLDISVKQEESLKDTVEMIEACETATTDIAQELSDSNTFIDQEISAISSDSFKNVEAIEPTNEILETKSTVSEEKSNTESIENFQDTKVESQEIVTSELLSNETSN